MSLTYANRFCWYDLHTPDVAASAAFYEALFGWAADGEGEQLGLSHGGRGFGGLEALPAGEAAFWLGYLGTDDLAARTAALLETGGAVVVEGMAIPNVGHIGVLADPSGAAFALYQPADPSVQWSPDTTSVGAVCWAELSAHDVDEAKAFYGAGFGWGAGDVMNSAPDGYNLMTVGAQPVLGIYEQPTPRPASTATPPEAPACSWTFCVRVDDVSTTVKRVSVLGGAVMADMEVPAPWFDFCSQAGQVHLALFTDPQGATMGLLGPSEA